VKVVFGFAIVASRSLLSMVKNCPECGTRRMEPYAVSKDSKHELLYRCNKCGFKEVT
jgi:predicted RNA-binding Zn-ribbon protein involved in translation (DUF1610 family)